MKYAVITTLLLSLGSSLVNAEVLDTQPKQNFYLDTLSEYLKKPIGVVSFMNTDQACPITNPETGKRYSGPCLKGINTVMIGDSHKLEHFLTGNDSNARESKYYKEYFPHAVALSFGVSPQDTSSIYVISPLL